MMDIEKDLLFGQIALSFDFVTAEQLEEALTIQEKEQEDMNIARTRSLGEIFLEQEYMTESEMEKVMEVQENRLAEPTRYSELKKRQILFGKLAVRYEYCTEEDLNRCLRIQGHYLQNGKSIRLGQIMVRENILTPEEVKELLKKQSKRILNCPECGKSLNIAGSTGEEKYRCESCGEVLESPPEDDIQVDESHLHLDVPKVDDLEDSSKGAEEKEKEGGTDGS